MLSRIFIPVLEIQHIPRVSFKTFGTYSLDHILGFCIIDQRYLDSFGTIHIHVSCGVTDTQGMRIYYRVGRVDYFLAFFPYDLTTGNEFQMHIRYREIHDIVVCMGAPDGFHLHPRIFDIIQFPHEFQIQEPL